MITAIGIVAITVKSDHEASCMALIQASDKPASVRIRMNRMANPAMIPVPFPISLLAMVAKLCPLWRTDANNTIMSCTPPPSTQPINIQSVPGK
ncbi:hypothetical protein D3C85_1065230 [compost metagenome]